MQRVVKKDKEVHRDKQTWSRGKATYANVGKQRCDKNNLQVLKKRKGPTFNLKVETVAGSLVACFCPDGIVPTVLCFSPDQGQHTLVTEQTKQQL